MNFDRLTQKSFARSGLDLALYDAGGDGTPVVFQHGLCGDAHQTAEAFPDDARLRLLTLECRGHGQSPAGDQTAFSIRTFADDVAALIGTLDTPTILGGISMGAAISLRLAVTRPELVRGLVLVRPAWIGDAAPGNLKPNSDVAELLYRLPPQAARAAYAASPAGRQLAADFPDNFASLSGFFSRLPIDVTAALLSAVSADGPGVSEAEIGGLAVPTLVVGTAQDTIHPIACAEQLAALIPGARYLAVTPKSVDRAAYVAELNRAILTFTQEL